MGKVQYRWYAGYFVVDLARHCIAKGIEFAIGIKRNTAVVRAPGAQKTPGGIRLSA